MLNCASTIGPRSGTARGKRGSLWLLQLYVAGRSPKSLTAFGNLKRICEEYLPGRYAIELIDLAADPGQAAANRIIAVPTLVRRRPEPVLRVIGDLSNTAKVLAGLDLKAVAA